MLAAEKVSDDSQTHCCSGWCAPLTDNLGRTRSAADGSGQAHLELAMNMLVALTPEFVIYRRGWVWAKLACGHEKLISTHAFNKYQGQKIVCFRCPTTKGK
jgi:hypothetical protein